MPVIIFTEHSEEKIKKSSLEAISYGVALAGKLNTDAIAFVVGPTAATLSELGDFGIKKVVHANDSSIVTSDTKSMAAIIAQAVEAYQADIVVFSNTLTAKGVAPRLSVRMKAGLVTGAVALPDLTTGFTVRKTVFSGKAFADVTIISPKKIISLNQNAFEIIKSTGAAEVIAFTTATIPSSIKIKKVNRMSGEISLAEADKVVSAGRGLKGPENWGMVEELAKLLGAATACSRPVADSNWRPHHEHVGQTGLAIAPDLYIAIGISGAIQHLAGVNRSKTIVVINKDPEAPFFKAADYGIIGDAFEVVPKMIEAIKQLKK